MQRKTAPNSSNKVSICLQDFSHWTFLFRCRLLSSSANQRVTITYVRSQQCFMECKKVWKRRSQTFPLQNTPEKAQQLDQLCRSRWRLQVSISPPEPVLSLPYLTYFIKMGPAPTEGLAQIPTELRF